MPEVLSDKTALRFFKKLEKHFPGYTPRPFQMAAIQSTGLEHDLLCVASTGGGKSLVFQLAAASQKGVHIVVSPLIALMRDQVEDAKKRGLKAAYLNSSMSREETSRVERLIKNNKLRLLYVSPEKLASTSFRKLLYGVRIRRVVADEAHCASVWSDSFRPEYAQIAEFVTSRRKRPGVTAVTATCTKDMEAHVAAACGLKAGYDRIINDPVRPNITHRVALCEKGKSGLWTTLEKIVSTWDLNAGRYIVYTRSRKATDVAMGIIKRVVARRASHAPARGAEGDDAAEGFVDRVLGEMVQTYHAGMNHADTEYVSAAGDGKDKQGRTSVQDDFKRGTCRIVCATNAFGMGIDVPDIRGIIHLGMPPNLEAYVQQSGRASRDGREATSWIITDEQDINFAKRRIDDDNPRIEHYTRIMRYLRKYATSDGMVSIGVPGIVAIMAQEREDDQSATGVSPNHMHASLSMLKNFGVLNVLAGGRGYVIQGNMRKLRAFAGADGGGVFAKAASRMVEMMDAASSNNIEMSMSAINEATGGGVSAERIVVSLKKRGLIMQASPTTMYNNVKLLRPKFKPDRKEKFQAFIDAKLEREMNKLKCMVEFLLVADKQSAIREYFLPQTVR